MDSDSGTGTTEDAKTYTEADFQAAVRDANAALEKNRNEILSDLGKTKDRLRKFEEVDLDEYKTLKAERARAEEDKARKEGDWKAMEKQMAERHGKAEQLWQERERSLTSALERHLIDGALTTEIANAKGLPKGLLPILRPQVKMAEVDGEFVVQVVDTKGHPRIADGKATPMTLKDLVEEARSDEVLARMFEGTGSSGGGASRSTAGGGGPLRTISAESKWSARDIADIAAGRARATS